MIRRQLEGGNTIWQADQWGALHASRIGSPWLPSEDVVRFCARHIRTRIGPREYMERRPCRRILDLGCGNGRHGVYFAQQGFEVSAIDVSSEALIPCREWLRLEGLDADLRCGSVDALAYATGEFDVVVSYGVLDHVHTETAIKAMEEVTRVLKNGGLLHLNLRTPESLDFGKGEEIELGTFILTEGHEKGLAQHFFTEQEMEKLLAGYRILNWELHTRWLDKARTLRDSRWAVSAQRPEF